MEKQSFNPYLPSYEYIPDGEPHVFGDRIYIYGSHDRYNGERFCMNNYVCYSAPVTDLKSWRYEGEIFDKRKDPYYQSHIKEKGSLDLFAPDVTKGVDGRYYLYYAFDFVGRISVAVSDTPAGTYEYYGDVHYPSGEVFGEKEGDNFAFDPGLLLDDDGKVYLYSGFSPLDPLYRDIRHAFGHGSDQAGPDCLELESDMLTIKRICKIVPGIKNSRGTGFEGHEFFEASSMRKFDGRYYFIYSSVNGHELCYASSLYPDHGFEYGGILHSNADIGYHGNTIPKNYFGNNHGSIERVGDRYYVFGHRQTNYHEFSRQAVAEEIVFKAGRFLQAECTSLGFNGAPLKGEGRYEARICCNLIAKEGDCQISFIPNRETAPMIVQEGEDRESDPNQYITAIQDGTIIGFKYFDFNLPKAIEMKIRGGFEGIFEVSDTLDFNRVLTKIEVQPSKEYHDEKGELAPISGVKALYFRFKGKGKGDFKEFTIL